MEFVLVAIRVKLILIEIKLGLVVKAKLGLVVGVNKIITKGQLN